jgi:hypothetical protein
VTVEVCARPPHTVFAVLTYNGRRPPHALLADLDMIRWRTPPPPPPPRSAIDWSTPDESTGEPFTVGDYPVEGAICDPPQGTGPRGPWTPAERASMLVPFEGVLRRHAVRVLDPGGITGLGAAGIDEATGSGPPPVAPGEALELDVLLAPVQLDGVLAALEGLGVSPAVTEESATILRSYRSQRVPTTVSRRRVRVLLDGRDQPATDVAAVLAALASTGGDPRARHLTAADAGRRRAHEVRARQEAAEAEAGDRRPRIRLLADPPLADAVIDVLRGLCDGTWTQAPAAITYTGTHRGNTQVRQRPGVTFTIPVERALRNEVLAAVAAAARVDPGDIHRIWVVEPDVLPADRERDAVSASDRWTASSPGSADGSGSGTGSGVGEASTTALRAARRAQARAGAR